MIVEPKHGARDTPGRPQRFTYAAMSRIAYLPTNNLTVVAACFNCDRKIVKRSVCALALAYMSLMEILLLWLITNLEQREPPDFAILSIAWDETSEKLKMPASTIKEAEKLGSTWRFHVLNNGLKLDIHLCMDPVHVQRFFLTRFHFVGNAAIHTTISIASLLLSSNNVLSTIGEGQKFDTEPMFACLQKRNGFFTHRMVRCKDAESKHSI